MTDLERRALLGDKQAQEECTCQGIVLPCPFCGGTAFVKTQKRDYGFSGTSVTCLWCRARVYQGDKRAVVTEKGAKNVPVENHKYMAIRQWNARLGPPIGRCGECANRHSSEFCECRDDQDFCSDFEPKGGETDGCRQGRT